jgi:predicted component of type VI protein secretion system
MNVRLVVEKNGKRIRVIHLKPPAAILGRGSGSTVRIPSADVSRRHCQIRLKDGFVTVKDLESVNGTYLNGDAIRGEQVVRPGDRLEVGPVQFIVEYKPSTAVMARLGGDDEPELLEVDEEEPEMLEVDDDEAAPTIRPMGEEDDAPLPLAGGENPEPREPVLSESVRLDLPEAGELRDLLQQLDVDEEELKPKTPAKKKPETPAKKKPEEKKNK